MKKILSISITLFFLLTNNLFAQKKANLEGIEIGNIAPEIELPNIYGDNFKLSELKGKIVLINFWASWCLPCRKKAPELLDIFNNYKDTDFDDGENGFEIVSVSLDKNEIAWKNSVKKDGAEDFLNIGDMKGWESSAATTYNIKSIPSNILLNGEGEIIAINISTDRLKKKLKRMKKSSWLWFPKF